MILIYTYLKKSTFLTSCIDPKSHEPNHFSLLWPLVSSLLNNQGIHTLAQLNIEALRGPLQYCTLIHLEITFIVNQLCQYMHTPAPDHWSAAKTIVLPQTYSSTWCDVQ